MPHQPGSLGWGLTGCFPTAPGRWEGARCAADVQVPGRKRRGAGLKAAQASQEVKESLCLAEGAGGSPCTGRRRPPISGSAVPKLEGAQLLSCSSTLPSSLPTPHTASPPHCPSGRKRLSSPNVPASSKNNESSSANSLHCYTPTRGVAPQPSALWSREMLLMPRSGGPTETASSP